MYIHERKDWPDFRWTIEKLAEPLASVRYRQGGLIGQMKGLGFRLQQEAVVETMLDATSHYDRPLTDERLFGWHAALFPTGRSGITKIKTGAWRDQSAGPMQVVSGAVGREKLHFEA